MCSDLCSCLFICGGFHIRGLPFHPLVLHRLGLLRRFLGIRSVVLLRSLYNRCLELSLSRGFLLLAFSRRVPFSFAVIQHLLLLSCTFVIRSFSICRDCCRRLLRAAGLALILRCHRRFNIRSLCIDGRLLLAGLLLIRRLNGARRGLVLHCRLGLDSGFALSCLHLGWGFLFDGCCINWLLVLHGLRPIKASLSCLHRCGLSCRGLISLGLGLSCCGWQRSRSLLHSLLGIGCRLARIDRLFSRLGVINLACSLLLPSCCLSTGFRSTSRGVY